MGGSYNFQCDRAIGRDCDQASTRATKIKETKTPAFSTFILIKSGEQADFFKFGTKNEPAKPNSKIGGNYNIIR
ncbi:hypothetical protein B9Z55_027078 [Caenorhabditis nigoni]|uniref:Uncharacterized protein n=1 Tax=Caenorhabditis nigoni TaxID=1611254 RepID=A0A2G5SJ88_9PELO|nr:hypothetical protein B9Z55_027078 [Caenorhabditis nigoni]